MRLACVAKLTGTQANEVSMVTNRSILGALGALGALIEPGAQERGKVSDSLIFDTLNPSA